MYKKEENSLFLVVLVLDLTGVEGCKRRMFFHTSHEMRQWGKDLISCGGTSFPYSLFSGGLHTLTLYSIVM